MFFNKGQGRFVVVVMALIVAGILIFLFPLINDMTFYSLNSSGMTKPEGFMVGGFIPYFWILVAVGVVVVAVRGGGSNENQ